MGYFSDKQIEKEEDENTKIFNEVSFEELQNYFPHYSVEQLSAGYLYMHFTPIRNRKIVNDMFTDYKSSLLFTLEKAIYLAVVNKLYTAH
tara:strand:+ start:319 stop:588 length:270 start_codon:yes stop_codon:yes gene_type:complete